MPGWRFIDRMTFVVSNIGARCRLPDQGGIITGQADNAVPTGRLTQVFLITKWRWAVAKGFL